jgi:ABC-type polysaccharide/polyol phosphate export permease
VFALACAVLVSAVGVLVRDVQHLLGLVMMLWFYLTPVFYDLGRVDRPEARWLRLNPLTIIVEAHRRITLEGRPPDWSALAGCAAAGIVLLLASLRVFGALEHLVIEEV